MPRFGRKPPVQAHLVAASVSDSLDDPAELRRIVTLAGSEVGDGRVIVVDRDGVLVADSAGLDLGDSYANRPGDRHRSLDRTSDPG